MITNRQIVLKNRPKGQPVESNFEIIETLLSSPNDNEVLIKTKYLSIDPYLRNMMNEKEFVGPSIKIGQVFGGGAVGEVMESNNSLFQKEDFVVGNWGWQTHANIKVDELTKLNPDQAPISTALGVMGISGLTAYFGMLDIGKPKSGETVVISAAAGAVGMLAGQIAKIYGAKVIGITGSDEKNDYLRNTLGFDVTINYRTSADLLSDLQQNAPDGIDVYFDNVGGSISDAVLSLINPGARIPICGQITQYNLEEQEFGPRVGLLLVKNSALMQGFSFTQYASRFPEALETLSGWIKENKLKYMEYIVEGFDNTPKAFQGLFSGENLGKLLVKI